jgi:aspartyl aminopeptidase
MQSRLVAEGFLEFVNYAVSPFHAVQFWKERLGSKGFSELHEHAHWELVPGGKYFFSRNQSTLFAFVVGTQYQPADSAFRIIGGHTDSPCPKLAPHWQNTSGGFSRLNVQLYGGALWHSWFDRDLTLGGRVIVEDSTGLSSRLVHIKRPILRIPNLAIHLSSDRNAFEFNKESQFKPLLATTLAEKANEDSSLLRLIAEEAGVPVDSIRDLEMCVVDSQPSALIGLHNEFISSPRLDNLMSTYCAMTALSEATSESPDIKMAIAFDNEEIGSVSMMGADSVVTDQVLTRIFETLPGDRTTDSLWSLYRKSWLVSADMAHAVHPNYAEKHQADHAPHMNKGIVIKINCNLRYATDSIGATVMRRLGQLAEVPTQDFMVKNDSPCGSTIGPLIAAKTGIRVIDIGAPQFSMHSVREIMGTNDADYYLRLMTAFFDRLQEVPAPCALD